MAFRSAGLQNLVRFNSSTSSELLDNLEAWIESDIADENVDIAHRAFSPSCIRCKRRSWFRLRGVKPDRLNSVDRAYSFTAMLGTACHEYIQSTLQNHLGVEFVDVASYIAQHIDELGWIDYSCTSKGYETLIELRTPYPVRFAVDGILQIHGEYHLLEIKTAELSTFGNLVNIRSQHEDQIKTYCTLLGLSSALVLYVERSYGDMRCFQFNNTSATAQIVINTMDEVLHCVDSNVAPNRLPSGDSLCISCPYKKKCKDWG